MLCYAGLEQAGWQMVLRGYSAKQGRAQNFVYGYSKFYCMIFFIKK
jgi:hypothetical protein